MTTADARVPRWATPALVAFVAAAAVARWLRLPVDRDRTHRAAQRLIAAIVRRRRVGPGRSLRDRVAARREGVAAIRTRMMEWRNRALR